MTTRDYLALALLLAGTVGLVLSAIRFVRVTLPHNYGSNPGFGVFETSALPWWAAGSVGVGLLTTFPAGAGAFAVGLLVLTVSGQLLGRIFGNRKG